LDNTEQVGSQSLPITEDFKWIRKLSEFHFITYSTCS